MLRSRNDKTVLGNACENSFKNYVNKSNILSYLDSKPPKFIYIEEHLEGYTVPQGKKSIFMSDFVWRFVQRGMGNQRKCSLSAVAWPLNRNIHYPGIWKQSVAHPDIIVSALILSAVVTLMCMNLSTYISPLILCTLILHNLATVENKQGNEIHQLNIAGKKVVLLNLRCPPVAGFLSKNILCRPQKAT